LALGGRPSASFGKRLMLPVSKDTVLRMVRSQARPRTEPLNVVGIDDWAFRRNHSYGTIVCDLERRRIVTLLPDREMATVEAWLAGHPDIRVLSRDRGGGYGEAASKALPRAVQVADRWHLMENASAAFPEPMPEGEQHHGGVAMPVPIGLCRLDQGLDFGRGQVFAGAEFGVRPPSRPNCPIYGSGTP